MNPIESVSVSASFPPPPVLSEREHLVSVTVALSLLPRPPPRVLGPPDHEGGKEDDDEEEEEEEEALSALAHSAF